MAKASPLTVVGYWTQEEYEQITIFDQYLA